VSEAPLILCADDDEDILALITLRLEHAGFRVVQATAGDQALAIARERRPAVAVLDVMMPRLTGIEVVRALRADESTRELRTILLSARVQDPDVAHGLDAGADAYLAKPFRAPALVALVKQLLASR
jgi:DNA-binding response OmpR family regulator